MSMKTPLEKQRENVIMTASKEDLTLMLYDGALRFINQAILAIEDKDFEKANTVIIKAQNIILEFRATLDMSYDIAQQMEAMYIYIYELLINGNIKKDKDILSEARDLVRGFRDTWKEAIVIARKEKAAQQKKPNV